jgi:hypothetical protein
MVIIRAFYYFPASPTSGQTTTGNLLRHPKLLAIYSGATLV